MTCGFESVDNICGEFESIKVTHAFISINEVIYTHNNLKNFLHVLVCEKADTPQNNEYSCWLF